ncbi:extracellular catalytic domain type 1 short-chain-length polyhydroxyalkanoate depolymerase [Azospirillum sp. sgz302134]
MMPKMPPEMAEATRLTRAGRLAEATSLIQRLLRGGQPNAQPSPDRTSSPPTVDAEAVTIDVTEPASNPEPRRPGLKDILRDLVARVAPSSREQRETPHTHTPQPGAGAFLAATFTNEAGTRGYKLYIPANHSGRPLPLVVMLHGCTQSPDDFAAGTRMNSLAEEYGCIIAYPSQAQKFNPQKCWNWFSADHQKRDLGEPSLIAGITRRIMQEHPVDPDRIYVAGLSAGGAIAAIMGATYPDLYAAVGVHSGLPVGSATGIPSALAAMKRGASPAVRRIRGPAVPTIVFHGDQDSTVHPSNGDSVTAQALASAKGLTATVESGQAPGGHRFTRTVHATSAGSAVCEQWVVHGSGHAWSGGSPAGSYTDPQGPDAAREMLRFFLQHARTEAGRPQ